MSLTVWCSKLKNSWGKNKLTVLFNLAINITSMESKEVSGYDFLIKMKIFQKIGDM